MIKPAFHSAKRHQLLLGLSAAFVSAQLIAQSSPKIEEVLVTGDPMQRSSVDTVSSISIIPAEQMEAMNIRDLYDLLLRNPNVNAAREDKFSVRGISNEGIGPGGTGRPTVSVFIDGARQPGRGVANTWDLRQIEFYRGPQSTAFGPGSLAGAVVVQSNAPSSEEYALNLKAGVSNYGGSEAGIVVGGPIIGDLAFRYAGETNQSDGEVTNITRDDDNWQARKRYMQRFKLGWQGQSWYSAILTYQDNKLREGSEYQPTAFGHERYATDNELGYFNDSSELWVLNQTAALNEQLSLSLILSQTENHNHRRGDYDISAEDGGYFINIVDTENESQELRLSYRSETLRGVIGLYHAEDTLFGSSHSQDLRYNLSGVQARADADLAAARDTSTSAIYGEADWDFRQDFTLTLGIRYEKNRAENFSSFIVTGADPVVPLLDITLPLDLGPVLGLVLDSEATAPSGDEVLLPKLALSYQMSDSISSFISFSQGYRAGSVDFVSEDESPSYGPEYTNNLDVGVKWQSGNWRLAATAFYIDYSDMQIGVRVDAAVFRTDNAGKAKSEGLELEFNGELGAGFSLFGGLGYVETAFLEYEDDGVNYAGNHFPNAPRHTANLGLNWQYGPYFATATVSQASNSFTDRENSNSLRADSRQLLGARLGYQDERYGIELYGQNLTDEYYITDRFSSESLGIDALYVGDPLEYGLRLHYSY
ncbi:TonB-dependent receptor [Spongiibacter sp. KMU-158]|uniref:TonB-dependent receptor n=1 Tax=Spongiibacter pelagi TaxID=2760804 RepID=A0A927BZV6_9GAMM|nr:TonB-dependent receptor [Spongiibacter pelagi]MBD2858114.1 TonB-dependent receptor [Spongiibacter pelagi]